MIYQASEHVPGFHKWISNKVSKISPIYFFYKSCNSGSKFGS